jgi:hypothetical protein
VQVEIENEMLVIRLPLQPPTPSSTGKTLVVASSYGNQPTTTTIDGKILWVGCNAYVKADRPGAAK